MTKHYPSYVNEFKSERFVRKKVRLHSISSCCSLAKEVALISEPCFCRFSLHSPLPATTGHSRRKTMKNHVSHRVFACGRLTPFFAGLLLFPALALSAGNQSAPPETGTWIDHSGDGAVEIYVCADRADRLCGRIVWLKEPLNAQGVPKYDKYNPKASLQRRPICGLPVLGNLAKVAEGGFDHGWIYDPKVGKSYSAAIRLAGRDRLTVTGYVGLKFLSKSFTWQRVSGDIVRCEGTAPAASPIKHKKRKAPKAKKQTTAKVEPAARKTRKAKQAAVSPAKNKHSSKSATSAGTAKKSKTAKQLIRQSNEQARPPMSVPKPVEAKRPRVTDAQPKAAERAGRSMASAAKKPAPWSKPMSGVGGPRPEMMPWELYRLGEHE
jgi:uncharacterized protein (DUF2147 family)